MSNVSVPYDRVAHVLRVVLAMRQTLESHCAAVLGPGTAKTEVERLDKLIGETQLELIDEIEARLAGILRECGLSAEAAASSANAFVAGVIAEARAARNFVTTVVGNARLG